LAPAVARAKAKAHSAGRYLEVAAVVSGTDEDPQDLDAQIRQLQDAGVMVDTSNEAVVCYVGRLIRALNRQSSMIVEEPLRQVDLASINSPLAAINFGLESFTESLQSQHAQAIQVDWRPPASGNEALMAILARMKNK
jgi:FdrA protein